MTAFVVVNPAAGHGRAKKTWPAIRGEMENAFPDLAIAESQGRGHTSQLVRQALRDGHLNIIAVGGDGTINEAVNGFFEHGVPVSPDAVLGFVAAGTQNQLARHFAIAAENSVARLRKSHVRRIDIGRLSCLSREGEPRLRYFINAASLGLLARIAAAGNRAGVSRLLGGRLALKVHAALAAARWHSPRLRLIADRTADQTYDEIAGVTLVAVANGRWFGAGLDLAPAADPSDGKFDIVIAEGLARRLLLPRMAGLPAPEWLPGSALRRVRAARLTAAPTLDTEGPVEVETDGESAGLLPATFEILPSAINLRV